MRAPRALFLLSRRSHSYITTPIFYANAGKFFWLIAPHIGHLYTAVLSDAANRWQKLKDPDGVHTFVSGTDEHGIKRAKKDPLKFCDESSKSFRNLFDKFAIETTDFIRTTEDRHKRCVEYIWKRLYDRDFIYKDIYSNWYSAVDECFFSENEVEDSPAGKVVKGTSHLVEWVEEHNYMFRLSYLKGEVRRWLLESDIIISDVIQPKHYLPYALHYLEYEGDLSISRDRSRLPWGIPAPGDDSQTIYVWMDALMNYLSVVGYPDTLKAWPPSWQVLGKDILKLGIAPEKRQFEKAAFGKEDGGHRLSENSGPLLSRIERKK
ncbi:tRNA ligase class I [Teladorsagia circumcincta]|uniref:tRNA ligase class I n=1 Tax=Teladorsagia circumcincta TaxID=45464 RepID=A0A2G9V1T4_TELCI|nr:tRNA ligase class I [Teladorsagia circumcincta]